MRKLMLIACASMAVLLFPGASAQADSWSHNWTGPYGVDRSATLNCGSHACGWNMQATGPNGATWSRQGGVVQGPYRSYGYRAFTGPQGNTFVRGGWWRRY